jgi:hypothetical protein
MRKAFLLIVVIGSVWTGAYPLSVQDTSKTFIIKGRITHANKPVNGAFVIINGPYKSAETDSNGNYMIRLPAKDYLNKKIEISFGKYRLNEKTIILTADKDREINVKLYTDLLSYSPFYNNPPGRWRPSHRKYRFPDIVTQ